jgi:uncharacterized membrane protein YeaQ/YmgE (transglycosylase-associated protein family)
MWTLIVWLSFGVVAGLFTHILTPGRDGLGASATVGLGIAGAIVGGLLGNTVGGAALLDLELAGLVGAGIGATAVLLASRSRRLATK